MTLTTTPTFRRGDRVRILHADRVLTADARPATVIGELFGSQAGVYAVQLDSGFRAFYSGVRLTAIAQPPTPKHRYLVYDDLGRRQGDGGSLAQISNAYDRSLSADTKSKHFILDILTGDWYDIDGNPPEVQP